MKYAVAAAAFVAVASAQSLSDVPKCAIPCLDDSIAKNTKCDKTDLECVCENFDKIQGDATTCVIKECGADKAVSDVLPAAEALCSSQGGDDKEEASSSVVSSVSSAVSSVAEEASSKVSSIVSSAYDEATSSADVSIPVETMPTVTPPTEGEEPTPTPTNGGDDNEGGNEGETPGDSGAAALTSVGAIAAFFLAALAL